MSGRDPRSNDEIDLDSLWRATGSTTPPPAPASPSSSPAPPSPVAPHGPSSAPSPPPQWGQAGRVPSSKPQRRFSGSVGGELFRALVVPGFSTMRRAGFLGAFLVLIGVVAPLALGVWVLLERERLITLVVEDRFLIALMVTASAAVLARFVAVTEVAIARQRFQRVGVQAFLAYVVLAALAVPVGFAVMRADQARTLLDDLFADTGTDEPVFVPIGGGVPGVRTVLLLGSDGGADRFGDRIDSIVLVSVHEASGRTGLVSVPRNLTRLQFPPGTTLAERFPNGFGDLANAVYPYVQNNADVALGFDIEGLSPASVAMAQAVGFSLDVRIDDYVFVDMNGFLELIDAVGGVTIDLETTVPLPPNIDGAKRPIPTEIGPGPVEMDGTLAIAYARTRYADSDYGRMERQRQLLSALAAQTSTTGLLLDLPDVADALGQMVQTSLSRRGFAQLVDALDGGSAVVESVGLAPPLVQPGNPDWPAIRGIVRELQVALATGVPSRFAVEPAA